MKEYGMNILLALALIALGLWGYFDVAEGAKQSPTALIPVIFGGIFLLCSPFFKPGQLDKKINKIVVHVVVLLTLLIAIALFMPLKAAIGREDTMAMVRIGIMIALSIIALIVYIQSFINARKARNAG